MQTLTLEVRQDHIDRLSKAKKPILSIAELIWNSVDADATEVIVRVNRKELGRIDSIEVIDNGLGITMTEAVEGFGQLGGSWKRQERQTRRAKRTLHGRQGQGRFRVFGVCDNVEWDTAYRADGTLKEFRITGSSSDKRKFEISDERPSKRSGSGTTVTLSNIISAKASLEVEKCVSELNRLLALYLKQYPIVRIAYDGAAVDPGALEDLTAEYKLPLFTAEDGKQYEVLLTIIEWKINIERTLYLCNQNGVTLRELPPGIQAPGYHFTAYLRGKLLEEMDEAGTIEQDDSTDLRRLLDAAKEHMRKHFLQRDAEKAASVVETWKEENVYPYDGEPHDILEETERQMFDVVAVSLDSYVSEFRESKTKNKKLTFNLLRYALESNPSSLHFILEEVVGLPKDKQDEFAALLQKTSLIAMINASKVVADRLDFLKGLEFLLYDKAMKEAFRERSRLHKLVSRNTWIFGDEYYLVNNDESLTNVLRKHLKDVAFDVDLDEPVLRADGSEGVIDVLLSKTPADEPIPEDKDVVISKILNRHPSEGRHHLVIELKRPSEKISPKVLSQTEGYAFAVAMDERFQGVSTTWTFWSLSNELTDEARFKTEQKGRPRGMAFQGPDDPQKNFNITIWAKPWSEVIEQSTGRLKFFQERLNYNASQSSGRKYLQDTYPKFIPRKMKDDKEA
jgi:hypothetical protein